jgi:hypothetical protein
MSRARARTGIEHLTVLARVPRPAGSEAEGQAREYAAQVLRDAGFDVSRERFGYSAFPGRYATPIGGLLAALAVLGAARAGLTGQAALAALTLVAGLALLAGFAALMLGDAVLTLPFMRAESENLVATRGAAVPRVWLVAHLDSKSQPVPSVARVAGVMLLVVSLTLAVVACGLQLASVPDRMIWILWWSAVAATVLGAPGVMASVVGSRSPGALDNASGVAAVLAAATALDLRAPVGIVLPSAEELGLAGARAWARGRAPATALNCDGVDDEGAMTIMYTRARPGELIDVISGAATSAPRVRRMPAGLLTDSVALAGRGWATVTLSRGSFASLRRVHTSGDSLAALRGVGVDEMATVLARAAEALV